MTSSFQRKIKQKLPEIAGVSPSIYTNHLLASTGIPDLDRFLGGGVAIGTVLVVKEDASGNFSKLLLKYFLSEGLVHNHSLMIAEANVDGKKLLNSLPSFEFETNCDNQNDSKIDESDKMKIAWRYQKQNSTKEPILNTDTSLKHHTFNLLKTVSSDVIEKSDIIVSDVQDIGIKDQSIWQNTTMCNIIADIKEKVKTGGYLIDPSVKKDHTNILRIGIHSLGNLLWGDLEFMDKNLCTFLISLRAIMRSCFGVAVITIPSNILHLPDINDRILLCSDYVLNLESFESEEVVNQVYKDYHGLIFIDKIPCIGALSPPNHLIQDPSQLVFKSKRTKFVIEKFHLPPDLSEEVARDQKNKAVKSKNIDF